MAATIAEAFRKCVLKMAIRLLQMAMPEVAIPPEILALDPPPDEDRNLNFFGSKDEDAFQALVREARFGDLTTYFEPQDEESRRQRARDPRLAVKLRDFTGVSEAHPLPDGAFFCGPIPREGSLPYRQVEPTTNPFDFTVSLNPCDTQIT